MRANMVVYRCRNCDARFSQKEYVNPAAENFGSRTTLHGCGLRDNLGVADVIAVYLCDEDEQQKSIGK